MFPLNDYGVTTFALFLINYSVRRDLPDMGDDQDIHTMTLYGNSAWVSKVGEIFLQLLSPASTQV
jgi:hypothetical protein